MASVYLDSCVVIHLREGTPEAQRALRDRLLHGQRARLRVTVSELTRLECRVQPMRAGDAVLLADYDRFFARSEVRVVPLTREVVDLATDLRAHHGIKTPDALHLAAALHAECDEFWTHDRRLAAVAGDQIQIELLP